MEFLILLLPLAGAALGLVLRRVLSRRMALGVAGFGGAAAALGVASLTVAVLGWTPLGSMGHGLVGALSLLTAAALIPLGLFAALGRSNPDRRGQSVIRGS